MIKKRGLKFMIGTAIISTCLITVISFEIFLIETFDWLSIPITFLLMCYLMGWIKV